MADIYCIIKWVLFVEHLFPCCHTVTYKHPRIKARIYGTSLPAATCKVIWYHFYNTGFSHHINVIYRTIANFLNTKLSKHSSYLQFLVH